MDDIFGCFRANSEWNPVVNGKKLRDKKIQYAIVVTKDRFIAVSIGTDQELDWSSDYTGNLAFLGIPGMAVGALLDKRKDKRSGKIQKREEITKCVSAMSREELLKRNPSNFEIPFEEIKNVTMNVASAWSNGKTVIEGNIAPILGKLGMPLTQGLFGKPVDSIVFFVAPEQDWKGIGRLVSSALQSKVIIKR